MKKTFLKLLFLFFVLAGCSNKGESYKYPSGKYIVGEDIPAGEYRIEADKIGKHAFFEVAPDKFSGIINNENFNSITYVKLSDAQHINIQKSHLVPIEDALPFDGKLKNGKFKVGLDIPEGEYTIKPNSNKNQGIMKITRDPTYLTVDMDVFSETLTVFLEEGQYISVNRATIIVK